MENKFVPEPKPRSFRDNNIQSFPVSRKSLRIACVQKNAESESMIKELQGVVHKNSLRKRENSPTQQLINNLNQLVRDHREEIIQNAGLSEAPKISYEDLQDNDGYIINISIRFNSPKNVYNEDVDNISVSSDEDIPQSANPFHNSASNVPFLAASSNFHYMKHKPELKPKPFLKKSVSLSFVSSRENNGASENIFAEAESSISLTNTNRGNNVAPIAPMMVNNGRHCIDFDCKMNAVSSLDVRNSLHENRSLKHSRSMVVSQQDKRGSDIDTRQLEKILEGDLYKTIPDAYSTDELSSSDESCIHDLISAPTPPIRADSLFKSDEDPYPIPPLKSNINWFPIESSRTNTVDEYSLHQQAKEDSTLVQNRGRLYKVKKGNEECSSRWCVLENDNFICYSNNACLIVQEHFSAHNILSIQVYKCKSTSEELYCFELNTVGKNQGRHIYGSKIIADRRIWMQLIAESLTNRFSKKITTNFIKMGWAYIKEGIDDIWVGAWIILSEREFYYAIENQEVKKMDLRKARNIVLQPSKESDNDPKTNDKGPNMLVDFPEIVLYLRMWTWKETKTWCRIIKLEAHNNGTTLEQQQLTKHDVPVIVDKCINFIYVNGSATKDIYRRSGREKTILTLLSDFRKNAFDVQLTTDQHSSHEVASVLKRFFRELPEPLLSNNLNQYLERISKFSNKHELVKMYKSVLQQLMPIVNYNTTRQLLGHLHFITLQSKTNSMMVENMAFIWCPTLLSIQENEEKTDNYNLNYSINLQRGIEIISQMISLYRYIFSEDPVELEKEKVLLSILKRSSIAAGEVVRENPESEVLVYLNNKDGKFFNISMKPTTTAYDICKELCTHTKLPEHELMLQEVLFNGKLIRPIHYEEKVSNIILKWSYWHEADREDNYLALAPLTKYREYIVDKTATACGDIKFADSKSNQFKLFKFQVSQGKLVCFKDKSRETVLCSWKLDDIVWYIGHEPKRNLSGWTMTFVDVGNTARSKNSYFGNVLMWKEASVRTNWISAMLKSRYPDNFLPSPLLIDF